MMTAQNMHRETKWDLMRTVSHVSIISPNVRLPASIYSVLYPVNERESVSAPHASSFLRPWTSSPFSSRALLLKLYHPCPFHLHCQFLSRYKINPHTSWLDSSLKSKNPVHLWSSHPSQSLLWESLLNSKTPQKKSICSLSLILILNLIKVSRTYCKYSLSLLQQNCSY